MAAIRLTIDTGGDDLRAERLVRRLREHLSCYQEFDVEFEEVVIDRAEAKGAAEAVALLVVATPLVKSLAPALSFALTSFLDRNKHTSVVVELDGQRRTVKLAGQSAAEQEQLLRQIFLDEEAANRPETESR